MFVSTVIDDTKVIPWQKEISESSDSHKSHYSNLIGVAGLVASTAIFSISVVQGITGTPIILPVALAKATQLISSSVIIYSAYLNNREKNQDIKIKNLIILFVYFIITQNFFHPSFTSLFPGK